MKIKFKLIIDAVLVVLLIMVMRYNFTGGLFHEIVGLILLVGFLAHVFINRKYYSAMHKVLKKKRGTKFKNRLAFIVNIVLICSVVIMIFSSLAISKDLFPAIGLAIGGFSIWRLVHVLCAVLLIICVLIHLVLHFGMFASLIHKAANDKAVMVMWQIGSKLLAVLIAIMIVKISLDQVVSACEIFESDISYATVSASVEEETETEKVTIGKVEITTTETTTIETTEETDKETSGEVIQEDDDDSEEVIDNTEPDNDQEEQYYEEDEDDEEEQYYEETQEPEPQVISLEEYLGNMFCSGCGRHCCLLSPQCGKGRAKAEAAQEEYYATYGA